MKNIFLSLISSLLFSACGQSKSDPTLTVDKTDTIVIKNNTSPILKSKINLDSVDSVNNASVKESGDNITKAYVSKQDNSIYLVPNIRLDHRIFGYKDPDIKSERLL